MAFDLYSSKVIMSSGITHQWWLWVLVNYVSVNLLTYLLQSKCFFLCLQNVASSFLWFRLASSGLDIM